MKYLTTLCIICTISICNLMSQSVIGTYKTIDDETGVAKSYIDIYEKNDMLYGKISKLLLSPQDKICAVCPGDKKGQKLVGMDVIWDMKKDSDNEWSGGNILDPESGKTYKCKFWFEDKNYDQLNVRGYIGFSLLGRNQIWYRIE